MIETKDLILRQGSADDWQDLYRNLWSREEAFRYMFKNPCPSEEHAAARTGAYAVMHEEVKTEFFVIEKASGQAIGIASIKELQPGMWTITDIAIGPDFQGKGYVLDWRKGRAGPGPLPHFPGDPRWQSRWLYGCDLHIQGE